MTAAGEAVAGAAPSAERVLDAICGYQRSAALKSAIELDLFTAVDEGARTAAAIAVRCRASQRGARILCDYLTVAGFLQKQDAEYRLAAESAAFLSRRSPAYLGATVDFYFRPELRERFDALTEAVRAGGCGSDGLDEGNAAALWVAFATAMVPLMRRSAAAVADLLAVRGTRPLKVLDIAAGHGLFGVAIAARNPLAEVVAVDSEPVLAVAMEQARRARISERYRLLPGDAFRLDFGTDYDVALVTNFLHHFPEEACVTLLEKVHGAVRDGGSVALLEFVPNPDRVSPAPAARFGLTMLASTAGGDTYTVAELQRQLERAGFGDASAHPLPGSQTVVLAHKRRA